MLRYTGHPFVDVGVATITTFAGKQRPEEVTSQDLENVAEYVKEKYSNDDGMTSYLSVVFTNNAVYTQPAFRSRRKQVVCEFVDQLLSEVEELMSVAAVEERERCIACAGSVYRRSFRQDVPLLTGVGVLNFFPNGEPGLPLCPFCLLSIATLPLGALKCSGRALIIHADDDAVTLEFAREHLEQNRRLLQLAGQGDAKYPDAKQVRTRLVEKLCAWARRQRDEMREDRPLSLTAYHFSNSGQGPDIDIYHLPSPLVDFLRTAEGAQYATTWRAIVRRAWWRTHDPDDPEQRNEKGEPQASRNVLYEDLFRLPDDAPTFIRRYFLRQAYRAAPKDDPRGQYRVTAERDLVSWPLTDLFLRKVVNMDKPRIEAIRALGDRLADFIVNQNDRRFWRSFYTTDRYQLLRNTLIKASEREIRAGRPPLIGFDDFITIFEEGEELLRSDWSLARDLVLIRLIEQLHERQWFAKNPDALPEDTEVGGTAMDRDEAVAE